MKILFRVDAGKLIGNGHLQRCHVLGVALIERGHDVFFMTKKHVGYSNVILDKRIHLIEIESRLNENEFVDDDYTTWNCGEYFDEVENVKSAVQEKHVDCIILDHYGIDNRFDLTIKELLPDKVLVVIDDIYEKHSCDILINQNFGASINDYLSSNIRTFLLGLDYLLFDERTLGQRMFKSTKGAVNNIVIFFGSKDETSETLKVVKAALNVVEESFKFKVIVYGVENEDLCRIKELIGHDARFELIWFTEKIADLFMWGDFFFGVAASTMWQASAFGLISYVVTQSHNQRGLADNLKHLDGICYMGEGSQILETDWENVFQEIKFPKLEYSKLSKRNQERFSGQGISKIINEIELVRQEYVQK